MHGTSVSAPSESAGNDRTNIDATRSRPSDERAGARFRRGPLHPEGEPGCMATPQATPTVSSISEAVGSIQGGRRTRGTRCAEARVPGSRRGVVPTRSSGSDFHDEPVRRRFRQRESPSTGAWLANERGKAPYHQTHPSKKHQGGQITQMIYCIDKETAHKHQEEEK